MVKLTALSLFISMMSLSAQAHLGHAMGNEISTRNASPVKEYWIAVESLRWNPAPGPDQMSGVQIPADKATFWALKYRPYEPGFTQRKAEDPLLGIAGPVIEANVGDHIVVHFKNLDDHFKAPHSIHVHGLQYKEAMDGSFVAVGPHYPGSSVAYGETFTYEYDAFPDSVGVWPYHDHAPDFTKNTGLGMFGAVRVHGAPELAYDREFYVFFTGFAPEITGLDKDRDFDTINGLAFMGNTPMFMAKKGQVVRFNVLGFGKEFHTFHIHGQRWLHDGAYEDTRLVGPATAWSIQFQANNPGQWMLHCHVEDHSVNGMMGMFMVEE